MDGRAAEAFGIAWDAADGDGREILGARVSADLALLGLRGRVTSASLGLSGDCRRVISSVAVAGGVALAVVQLVVAAWPPGSGVADPLASAGTAIYLAWLVAGTALLCGRETLTRCAMTISAVLTVSTGFFADALGVRRPALFVLATLLMLTLLAFGVRPVARLHRTSRVFILGGAVITGLLTGTYCRAQVSWPSSSLYYGSVPVLAGLAQVVLVVLAVASIASLGSRAGRRSVFPALMISAGPWALLAARGSSDQGRPAHEHMIAVTAAWFVVFACCHAVNRHHRHTARTARTEA